MQKYEAFLNYEIQKPKTFSRFRYCLLHKGSYAKHINLFLYWRSYLQFYSSIYHLKKCANETAEKEIDKGIDWMDDMKKKNSEDYALLALLQGFGIQFKGVKVMFISSAIKNNAKQAMAIDTKNESSALYTADYSTKYYDYFQLRMVYFGLVWQLNY